MAGPLDMQVSYSELNAAIGVLRGWGSGTSPAWSAAQIAAIDSYRRNGLRSFYRADGRHVWSFLRPVATMTVYGTVEGTVDSSAYDAETSATTINTAAATFYPTMVGATLTADDVDYTILGYTSATAITVSGNVAAALAAETEFSIASNGIFALPDDFAGMFQDPTYAVALGKGPVRTTGEARIRRLQQPITQTEGPPCLAAVRPRVQVSGSLQAFELVTDLVPDQAYVWTYRYRVLPTDASEANPYPYGAAMHAETILESCLAAAELDMVQNQPGTHRQRYMELLAASLAMDKQIASPDVIAREVTPWDGRHGYRSGRPHSYPTWLGFVD